MAEQNHTVSFQTLFEHVEKTLGSLGRIILALMGAVVTLQILFRWLPIEYGAVWTTEIARYLLVLMTLTGIPYAMRRGNHISIRPLLRMLSDTLQKYLLTLANLLVIGMCTIGAMSAVSVLDRTMGQSLPTVGWLKVGYVMLYLALMFALCILFIVEKTASTWISGITKPEVQDDSPADMPEEPETGVKEGSNG